MKIKKLPLVIYLSLSILVLPGWRTHQVNEVYQYPIIQKTIMRFAIVVGKDEELVCQVDLTKHPDLVPNFAQLSAVNQVSPSRQEFVSIAEGSSLPPCTDKYLNYLKESRYEQHCA